MRRKSIPLTMQYANTPGSCQLVLAGVKCPHPCNGTCLAATVFLCAFGLTDSPWMERASADRDRGPWEQTVCAVAIAIKYGVNQAAVLPTAIDRARARLAALPNVDPVSATEALLGPVPSGCVAVAKPFATGPSAKCPVVGYGLWSGMLLLRSDCRCCQSATEEEQQPQKTERETGTSHWAAFVMVPKPPGNNNSRQQQPTLTYMLVEPGRRPTDSWLSDTLPSSPEMLVFYGLDRYQHMGTS